MKIELFTDGSCLGNPGPGGFCAVIKKDNTITKIIKGGAPSTTNNRMEMSAIIAGLYFLHKNLPAIRTCKVYSDSSLVISTLNDGWKRKKNLDLWEKLDHLVKLFDRISWKWIKGHAGHPENTLADKTALAEAIKKARA